MFMEQPPGFEAPGREEWVMKLQKSIYGMKQASRVWNKTFHQASRDPNGFRPNRAYTVESRPPEE